MAAVAMKVGANFSRDYTSTRPLFLSFSRSLSPFRCRNVSFRRLLPLPCRFQVRAVKRSPKRLKYATPRFSKVDCQILDVLPPKMFIKKRVSNFQDGGVLYVEVDPSGIDSWKLEPVIQQLKEGAVGVIPTDTVYAIVCDMNNPSAIERLRRIKNIETSKPLSILCRSFHDIDVYTMGFPRGDSLGHPNIFRAVKQCLPGPYTFILTASKNLPKLCLNHEPGNVKYTPKKSIGVRIPDDPVTKAILEKIDSPLISTSVKAPKEDQWILDPIVIAEVYGKEGLDFIVDAGLRIAEPSTVVDMTGSVPKIIRLGKGPPQPWMVSEDEEVLRG
uniref:Threonylcarbamoyl-AMP synthase n=1 Tax=Chenopodium quinoa TaxID=63459 RepID=A0A803KWV8_CHEQI